MPLSINVGLSRKASKDYQSTGVSINVTAELDQALLARPDQLQKQIGDLYAQAHHALDGQMDRLAKSGNGARPQPVPKSQSNGNGRASSPMTASQRRAILAIAKRGDINLDAECCDFIGEEFDRLSLRQASELIDHLKDSQPAGNGRR